MEPKRPKRRPRALHMGDDVARLRGPRLCWVSAGQGSPSPPSAIRTMSGAAQAPSPLVAVLLLVAPARQVFVERLDQVLERLAENPVELVGYFNKARQVLGADPPRSRRKTGRTSDGISGAAGGPSAAMPTATVRRGVVASDDRKRDAAQLRAPRPRLATTAQRQLRPSAAQRRCDGVNDDKCTNGYPAIEDMISSEDRVVPHLVEVYEIPGTG